MMKLAPEIVLASSGTNGRTDLFKGHGQSLWQTLIQISTSFVTVRLLETTIAISHVWSHGQGGRPEDGMNQCLHERYKRIALLPDCDSYWMDTACIPNDLNSAKRQYRQLTRSSTMAL